MLKESWLKDYYPVEPEIIENENTEDQPAEESAENKAVPQKIAYPWDRAVAAFFDFADRSYKYADECASEMWIKSAEYYNDIGLNLVSDYSKKLEEAASIIPEPVDDEILPQNPKLCMEKTGEFLKKIPEDARLLNKARLSLDESSAYENSIKDLKASIEVSMRQLSGIEGETAVLSEKARKQYQNANFTKNEGYIQSS